MTHLRCLTAGVLLLFALVLWIYLPVAHFSFLNLDDNLYVTQNSFVNSGLSWRNVRWAFSQSSVGHWHPVTWISHMLDCQLFGLAPGAHHLVNVFVHAANASLLFLFLSLATQALGPSFFTAAIFASHPMRLESVAWISERKDVLSVCFGLLCLLAYLHYVKRPRARRFLGVWGLLTFSLMCKPTLVTLPALLLLIDYWPLGRLSLRPGGNASRLVCEKIPLAVTSLLFSFIALNAQRAGGGYRTFTEFPLSDRLASVSVGYLTYFGKLFWPTGFGVFYPSTQLLPGVGVGAFIGCVAIAAWAVRWASSRPPVVMGSLWFLISLLPVVGLVPIGGQAFADRWTYLPHIGLLIAGIWIAKERAGLVPAVCVVALCLLVTRSQLPHWQNSVTLFEHTLAVAPNNLVAHTNLGSALNALGNHEAAAEHFTEAIRLNPGYPEALNNLGIHKAQTGKIPEARSLFLRAIRARPDFAQAHYNLGLAEDALGNHLVAIDEWVTTLSLRPQDPAARGSLDVVLGRYFSQPCQQWKEALTEADRKIQEKVGSTVRQASAPALGFPGRLTELAICLN